MMIKTHEKIDPELCGTPVELGEGTASVELLLTERMTADASGLIHGGFIFGLADYAAMLAVNRPTVVLAAAEVSFVKPAMSGDGLLAEASITAVHGKKRSVTVIISCKKEIIFRGMFTCAVPENHVLEGNR
ncbi:MAG TPA: PaaI family thioesterase [Spirochaetota bacterium]|nr:PaaI family thioesterase [Spirochaetota bacterium]HPI88527.1 PaaI family thioesterase [Spirochaetota bacterium]HPR48007.1 PaaI family thioesterase [Spirochaetota bacterium]